MQKNNRNGECMRLLVGLASIVLLWPSVSQAAQEDDFLIDYIPILAATLNCEPQEYEACSTPRGCRNIDGFWQQGMCVAKSESFDNTALFDGRWFAVTSFSSGDFFNYLTFDVSSIESINTTADYFLRGTTHTSADFNDTNPNDAIVSFDSSNQDWFILDYWGRDIGSISSLELNRVSDTLFTGCEFFLNYPDLTYQDGVCNPVRMTRGGFFKQTQTNKVDASRPQLRVRPSPVEIGERNRLKGSSFRTHNRIELR